MVNEKKTTSIKINEEAWKKFRILCLKKGLDASEYVENLIIKELKE